MLRRNRADTSLEIRLSVISRAQIPSYKIFRLSSLERAAPILSTGPTFAHPTFQLCRQNYHRLDHLFLATRCFSVDPLLLVRVAGASVQLGRQRFFSLWTQFSSFASHRNTGLVPTLKYGWAARVITVCFATDPLLLIPFHRGSQHCTLSIARACSLGYEVSEFGKHRKGTDSCFGRFGQHRNPVGAQIAEETGPIRQVSNL